MAALASADETARTGPAAQPAEITPAADVGADPAGFLARWAEHPDRARARQAVAAETARLIAVTGRGLALSEADLAGFDLSGFDLTSATLNRARLHGTDLTDAILAGASLVCPGMERTVLVRADLNGAYMHALAAQVCDFSHADMRALVDATGSLFHGCRMEGTRLDGAALAGATFYQCGLAGAQFGGANLQGAGFNECHMAGAQLRGATVAQLSFTKCQLHGVSFTEARGEGLAIQRPSAADGLDLRRAHLPGLRLDGVRAARLKGDGLAAPGADVSGCALPGARLRRAELSCARFLGCALDRADFTDARLDGASFHDCTARGAILEGAAAENLSLIESSFPGARMARLNARTARFRDCDLTGADLKGAYLYRAMLTGDPPRAMSLARADLEGAVLVQAYLAADLSGARLARAHGAYARLNQCILRGADLSGTGLYEASLVKTDCADARVTALEAPIFADRASGLLEAVEAASPSEARDSMVGFLRNLEALLRAGGGGST